MLLRGRKCNFGIGPRARFTLNVINFETRKNVGRVHWGTRDETRRDETEMRVWREFRMNSLSHELVVASLMQPGRIEQKYE